MSKRDDARREGRYARRMGNPVSFNPYPRQPPYLRMSWHAGWCDEDMVIMSEDAARRPADEREVKDAD